MPQQQQQQQQQQQSGVNYRAATKVAAKKTSEWESLQDMVHGIG